MSGESAYLRHLVVASSLVGAFSACYVLSSCTKHTGLKNDWRSWALGQVDYATLWLSSMKSRFFVNGYGNLDSFYNGMNATSHETAASIDIHETHAVTLEAAMLRNGLNVHRGSFYSPIAKYIAPLDVKSSEDPALTAHFELILPPGVSWEDANAKGMPLVIQLPATGDEGFSLRRNFIAAPLAKNHQFVSILLQIPFYGKRRLPGQHDFTLNKLEYVSHQSLGAVMEALTIMTWLKEKEKYSGVVGLTGISFGGSMSSLASLFCQYDHPVITLVPAHSPVVFVDGGLGKTIDFSVFGPIEVQGRQMDGREAVRALLSQMTIGKETTLDIPPVRRLVIQISAVHDAYVLLDPAVGMFEHLQSLPNMVDSELQLIPGGHVWGIFAHRNLYVKRIVEGFERFAAATAIV